MEPSPRPAVETSSPQDVLSAIRAEELATGAAIAVQEAIRLMQAWRSEGKTYRDLCGLLEEMGIETKEGGKLWLPMTVKRILCRPA